MSKESVPPSSLYLECQSKTFSGVYFQGPMKVVRGSNNGNNCSLAEIPKCNIQTALESIMMYNEKSRLFDSLCLSLHCTTLSVGLSTDNVQDKRPGLT